MRILETIVKSKSHELLWQVKRDSNISSTSYNSRSKRKIRLSIEFHSLIVIYNNVFFFCSEFFTIDKIHSVWTIYRCQNSIKHLLDALFAEFDDVTRFAQIHIIDSTQKILKRRMKSNTDDDVLNEIVLLRLQRLFKKVNFYVKDLKTCAKRIKKTDELEVKMHLKQNDFNRRERNTMNKFIFDEIVVVIIMSNNQNDEKSINKNILMQTQNENLISIFYWQSCYMFLRYSLIFSYNEQSWNKNMTFEKHQINMNLLTRKNELEILSRHEYAFIKLHVFLQKKKFFRQNIDDVREQNQLQKEKNDDIDARVEKKKFKKMIQKKFYRFCLQVNIEVNSFKTAVFFNRFLFSIRI